MRLIRMNSPLKSPVCAENGNIKVLKMEKRQLEKSIFLGDHVISTGNRVRLCLIVSQRKAFVLKTPWFTRKPSAFRIFFLIIL